MAQAQPPSPAGLHPPGRDPRVWLRCLCAVFVLGSAAKPDNRVSVVALEDGKLIRNVTVGKGAHGIVIARDGRTAYVTNTYANTISAIDLGSLSAGKAYPVGKGPNGIAAR